MKLVFRAGVALGWAAIALFAQQPTIHTIPKPPILEASAIPIVFEPNLGQAASDVRFVSRYGASTLLLSKQEARILVTAPQRPPKPGIRKLSTAFETSSVRMQFPGGALDPEMEGVQALRSRTNYFLGPAKPFSVSQYQRVIYRSLYPGVDLIYHTGNAGRLEHDFVIQPGSDPSVVRVAFPRSRVSLTANGDLMVRSGRARVVEKRPVIYQETEEGRKKIAGGYKRLARGEYGFELGAYDRALALVIDPEEAIQGGGYIGGAGTTSLAAGAMSSSGSLFLTGQTASTFPGQSAFPATPGAGPNAFVIKMSPDMTQMEYTAIIGGEGGLSAGLGIKVDESGQAFVDGITTSPNFPRVNSFGQGLQGPEDLVLFKLSPDGKVLIFSSLLGGAGAEVPLSNTMDTSGNFYFCGNTTSPNFPIPGPALQSRPGGSEDAFIVKIDPTGHYVAGTLLGGPGADECDAIAYSNGFLYAGGTTSSATGLPVTSNALQKSLNGTFDTFVAKFSSDLTQAPYFSYFGGPGNDTASAIAVSPMGDLLLAGATNSSIRFPQSSLFPTTYNGGGSDGFVALFQFNPVFYSSPILLQSVLLGGSAGDNITSIAPMQGPGGGFFAARFFGTTDSTFSSTLPGFGDCKGTGSMFFGDLPFFGGTPLEGCPGRGIVEGSTMTQDGRVVVLADVQQPVVQLTQPFPLFPTGSDGAGVFIVKSGFTDPTRFNGSITLDQVSWIFQDVEQANSPTGELSIDVAGVLGAFHLPFAYLNISINGLGWVGQNIRLDLNEGVPLLSTPVLLQEPTLQNVPILNALMRIQVTPDPVVAVDPALPTVLMPVRPVIHGPQGVDPVTQVPPPPAKDRVFPPQGDTYSHVLARSDINVQTATNQCAPMSYANSLAYLASQNDNFKLPHPHQPGLKGDNTLVGQLDTAMGRTATSRTQGRGVYEQNQLKGKFLYLKNNGLDGKLVNKYQGALLDSTGLSTTTSDYSSSGITSSNQGANVTFDWLCSEIQQGEDVELMYAWSGGAHAVRMFGCGKTRGAPWIKVLDDGNQTGQSDPTDSLGLRTTQIWVGDLTGTGELNFDNVGQKIRAAFSESFKPEVKAAPGASPSSFREAITNGASYVRGYLTKAAIGAMFGLFQTLAGNTTEPQETVARDAGAGLPTDIHGTEVLFNGKPIPLFFVTPQQIDFQVPADQPPGEVTIVVKQGAKQSAAFTIVISATPTPGIILIDPSVAGPNHGAVQNHDFSPNLPASPAKPGEAVIVYVTGLGETDIPVASGAPSPSPAARYLAKVTATIGGLAAEVQFAGLTPESIALGQVNLVVPNLPPGDYPVVITADGAVSNAPLMSVGKP